MTYKERSRFENRKKYRRADIINTLVIVLSMLCIMISGASFDFAMVPSMILATIGLIGFGAEIIMIERSEG